MVTQMKRNVSSDVAADISVDESLSFAGLLCIQDQCSKQLHQSDSNPLLIAHQATENSDFEFDCAPANPSLSDEANPPLRNSLSGSSIDDRSLSPQTTQPRSTQANAATMTYNNLAVLLPLSRGGSQGLSPNNSIRRNGSENNQDSEKQDSSSFLGKIFKPCRICNAVEPTAVRQETIRAKQMKSR